MHSDASSETNTSLFSPCTESDGQRNIKPSSMADHAEMDKREVGQKL